MGNIKFIASQARSIYQYASIRTKILKCNADIFFNKQCLTKNIVPKYANLKAPVTSKAAYATKNRICSIRIKDEIRVLYMKKDKLNPPKKTLPNTFKTSPRVG